MTVLCTWAPEGGLLSVVAPLALGVAAGTALVVDLDEHGPRYPGPAGLIDVAEDAMGRGPEPGQKGVAVLRNGGIGVPPGDTLRSIVSGWPAVVFRLPRPPGPPAGDGVVPVLPLLPGAMHNAVDGPAVYQRCGWGVRAPGPGPVLPRPRRETIRALLEGRRPVADRWLRTWRAVWEQPWT